MAEGASLRIDKFLWFARIAKTRSLAQSLSEQGHLRIAGRRVDRAHMPVRVGDILTLAIGGRVRILKVEELPVRRGPAAEARSMYSELPEGTLTSQAEND